MKISELEYASSWHRRLKDAQRDSEALLAFNVVGVVIDTRDDGLHPIRIERGGSTGTGSVNSICWSDDLQNDLTDAFHAVFQKRIEEARKNLDSVGVEVAC